MPLPLHRLPSLDLLRGFVAVGRHMSITRAANELFLTQSAVSRQIRTLEESLGVKLFIRKHRAIAFTPQGARLFQTADSALQQVQDRLGLIQERDVDRPVSITSSAGVAGLWLLPRLQDFLHAQPNVEVSLSASDHVSDLKSDGIDLAIRYCANGNAPDGSVLLFDELVQPVVHSSTKLKRLTSKSQFKDIVLLEFEGPYRPWLRWNDWLEHQGWSDVKPRRILRFNQYDQLIHAAVSGQGIALGRLRLIDTFLNDGRLKVLDAPSNSIPCSYGYWLVSGDQNRNNQVDAVAKWICGQALKTSKYAFE